MFGLSSKKDGREKWPLDENGEPAPPAFLTHVDGSPLDLEMVLSLLRAYNIPTVCEYPANGFIGKLVFGSPSSGTDIFVPETMLEDAQNILNADISGDDEV